MRLRSAFSRGGESARSRPGRSIKKNRQCLANSSCQFGWGRELFFRNNDKSGKHFSWAARLRRRRDRRLHLGQLGQSKPRWAQARRRGRPEGRSFIDGVSTASTKPIRWNCNLLWERGRTRKWCRKPLKSLKTDSAIRGSRFLGRRIDQTNSVLWATMCRNALLGTLGRDCA